MLKWINQNKESIIRVAFLIPILSVAIISISHVVSWYNLANPISWAIYLSIAIEVAALSSIAAASVKVKGFSVWFVFIIVTLIQFIGNIYFSYTEINVNSKEFKDWAELTLPLFDSFSDTTDILSQRRLLAILEGGLLPLISLTCLHFFIKYGDRDLEKVKDIEEHINDEEDDIHLHHRNMSFDDDIGYFTDDSDPEMDVLFPEEAITSDPEEYVIFTTLSESDDKIIPQSEEIERTEVGGGVSLTKIPLINSNKLRRQ
jgi:hypothetical protein